MNVLGLESSCDETAVALVAGGRRIVVSEVASQIARHRPFGGVVPEIAAREHASVFPALLERVLAAGVERGVRPEAIAVTDHPGLLQALLTGIAAGEALALVHDLPLVGVNHIEAHLAAPFLASEERPRFPLLSLVVSGGHTHLFVSRSPRDHRLLGATIDDAAGEAFDKVAKMLGLGYPGGPRVQAAAEKGDPRAFRFKRPLLARESLDFSFSGLKTAVAYECLVREANGRPTRELRPDLDVNDVAASFQAVVVDVLVEKLRRAHRATGIRTVAVGGGVACNGPLRAALSELAEDEDFELLVAPPALCTDNAAMVAAQGAHLLADGGPRPAPEARARARWPRVGPREALGDPVG